MRNESSRLGIVGVALCLVVIGCNEGQRSVLSGLKPYRFPTAGMEPTIRNGEFIYAKMYRPDERPPRGALVVFLYPLDQKETFGKRVVAVPGDTVEIRNKQLIVNGVAVREPYAAHSDPQTFSTSPALPEPYRSRDNFGPVAVKPDEYFVLGDNRDKSADSRYWGSIPRKLILGRIVAAGEQNGPLRRFE
ncbi:MAG TPA: signal peptidase I [Thermoanaerobaculia bacterium]|nr:signal peptidase I [Thermoanaerobaculia bacterium]